MIFYFSGTGNSLYVAKELAMAFNEDIISIADELNKPDNEFKYDLRENENLMFIYPVHSWGPARLITDFISKLNFSGYFNQPVYSISTCGDNCGYTNKIIEKVLKKKHISLKKSYSIQMPNNYILMSGFNTDPEDIKKQKLSKAPQLIEEIVRNIKEHKTEEIYTIGSSPWVKSKIVYPLFVKFVLGRSSFYAKDNCTSCGLCEEICPTKNIIIENGRPKWGKTCVQCVACIHRCPVYAIEYGKISQDKGRYHHPDLEK
ncbi:MAG: EFR1 family ferrodoxin [Bacteroidales bacterium]|jgi:flavodoxin/ferredoxin|nr:EFR1 family ferrodoxin [Bacteroidales bacterium]